jgi:hypothetical protein
MTATNHALTGAIIGLAVHNPLIALPAAVLSHFVCDAIPHFDKSPAVDNKTWMKSNTFKNLLIIDAGMCVALVIVLLHVSPMHWFIASVCAFLATSPDLLWINMFIKANENKPWKTNKLLRFASRIQWFARPIGGVVEVCWFVAAILVIRAIIR